MTDKKNQNSWFWLNISSTFPSRHPATESLSGPSGPDRQYGPATQSHRSKQQACRKAGERFRLQAAFLSDRLLACVTRRACVDSHVCVHTPRIRHKPTGFSHSGRVSGHARLRPSACYSRLLPCETHLIVDLLVLMCTELQLIRHLPRFILLSGEPSTFWSFNDIDYFLQTVVFLFVVEFFNIFETVLLFVCLFL